MEGPQRAGPLGAMQSHLIIFLERLDHNFHYSFKEVSVPGKVTDQLN